MGFIAGFQAVVMAIIVSIIGGIIGAGSGNFFTGGSAIGFLIAAGYQWYFEDLDLALRAEARGWHVAEAPAAVAYHWRGGTLQR